MSKVGKVVGSITGTNAAAKDAAKASKKSAQIQADATVKAAELDRETAQEQIAFQKSSLEQARSDLAPFRQSGVETLDGLSKLITDPQEQLDFINNNPFFYALAERSNETIMGNNAAKGKVGSGGTAEALQNSLILLGADLVNQNIGQRQNLATLGANAASGQATATQNTANSVSNIATTSANNQGSLITQGANAQAAGIIGAANAKTNAAQQNAQTISSLAGAAIMACDERVKRKYY